MYNYRLRMLLALKRDGRTVSEGQGKAWRLLLMALRALKQILDGVYGVLWGGHVIVVNS